MRFDLHCHTKHGSLDGKISIETYIDLLISHGFDGMLITDHNSYKGFRAWKKLCQQTHRYDNFVTLKGVEYDTLDAGHFIVIMPDDVKLPILEIRGMPLSILLKIVHAFGGILGPAHPYGAKFLSAMHSKKLKKYSALVYDFDFIEVHNTCNSVEANIAAIELAKKYHKPGIAGSDAHKTCYIGTAYTDFDFIIRNNNDLINAVRLKKIADCGGETREYKEPGLLARLIPVSIAWKIYNRGLSLIKAHSRKINLEKLTSIWDSLMSQTSNEEEYKQNHES